MITKASAGNALLSPLSHRVVVGGSKLLRSDKAKKHKVVVNPIFLLL